MKIKAINRVALISPGEFLEPGATLEVPNILYYRQIIASGDAVEVVPKQKQVPSQDGEN